MTAFENYGCLNASKPKPGELWEMGSRYDDGGLSWKPLQGHAFQLLEDLECLNSYRDANLSSIFLLSQ
jgi:hypothetical protein